MVGVSVTEAPTVKIGVFMKSFYQQHPEYLGNGKCCENCIVQGEKYRFSVLTPHLLRLEYSESGVFEDRPSQVVLNRCFPKPDFDVCDTEDRLEISTEAFHLVYNKKEFAPENLYIDAKNRYTNYGGRWKYGANTYGNPPRHHNLLGTARTLDKIDGEYPLDFGLQDSSGRSFFDDSCSLLLDEDGWVNERIQGNSDVYFLCYHRDYFAALADFYRLTGAPPLLPRYALGNWWSRYWKYSEDSYLTLLDRFQKEGMPFTVAMLDMDWHVTDVPEKYGRGWTGFTWNKKLFPDPQRFLNTLHERGLHSGLNLHPADGVQAFEAAYTAMAQAMGIDSKNEAPVHFDAASPAFLKAYFKHLITPLEQDGADFWWIDWQQGTESNIKHLDPLWVLNHFHYLHNCKKDRRGMILSRYAGLGSHRYPLGFSGDTIATWASLAFQPYFTANAANVGYDCWSHDISGFKTGVRERELFIRWVQYGVFSPIMRLHSSNNPFCSKEPWSYGEEIAALVGRYLRLRHRMIPYIYTANYEAHTKLKPMITPLYYRYPNSAEAYEHGNEYFFGEGLLVFPITEPTAFDTDRASVVAWLPNGTWIDAFCGRVYRGDRTMTLTRTIEDQAVLAKAGAIVPMAKLGEDINSVQNPELMDIYVFAGENGQYTLYEDSGDGYAYCNGQCAFTEFAWTWGNTASLDISVRGELSVLPQKRRYRVHFRGVEPCCKAKGNGILEQSYDADTCTLSVSLAPVKAGACVTVSLENAQLFQNRDYRERVFRFLMTAQLPVVQKTKINSVYKHAQNKSDIALALKEMTISKSLLDALYEITFAN